MQRCGPFTVSRNMVILTFSDSGRWTKVDMSKADTKLMTKLFYGCRFVAENEYKVEGDLVRIALHST